jgi:Zn-dependent protease with chaperone function
MILPLNTLVTLPCIIRFFRTTGSVVVIAVGVISSAMPATVPANPVNLRAGDDHDELLSVIEQSSIRYRFPGDMMFLTDLYGPDPAKADFMRRLSSIGRRLDLAVPDVLIVNPPLNASGKPEAQKPDAGVGWAVNINGQNHYLIFVTRYLQANLTDGELLAVLAHEMEHLRQLRPGFEYRNSRRMEAEADAFALFCPEVDPHDFRNMVLIVEKLQDRVARRHPLLYGDFTGLTALVPLSIQTKVAFGGNHPLTGSRIKEADKEIARRAARAENALPDHATAAK